MPLEKRTKKVENIISLEGIFMSSITITNDNFESEVLQSPVPVLIDFWAAWCGPCKMISPLVDQIAGEYSGRLKVGKVNVDEETAIAEKHGIVSIPTLILYKDGVLAGQKTGAAPKHDIISLFKNLL
jgi:thioredoxin 1